MSDDKFLGYNIAMGPPTLSNDQLEAIEALFDSHGVCDGAEGPGGSQCDKDVIAVAFFDCSCGISGRGGMCDNHFQRTVHNGAQCWVCSSRMTVSSVSR